MYLRPLADIVLPHGVQIVTYADDTQLVVALNRPKISVDLEACLKSVATWMDQSYLKLNGEKTELMILGNQSVQSQNFSMYWPNCLGPSPKPKERIKSLGIWLDRSLNLDYQGTQVAATCHGLIRQLRKILPILPETARRTLVQALTLPRLDYCNALYLGAPKATVYRLQVAQNSAARVLYDIPRSQSAKEALKTLHWLPMRERIMFKSLCVAHKTLWGTGPKINRTLMTFYQPSRSLRSVNKFQAVTPKIRRVRAGGRTFAYNATKLWNRLPIPLRSMTQHLTFRKPLKTWLYQNMS